MLGAVTYGDWLVMAEQERYEALIAGRLEALKKGPELEMGVDLVTGERKPPLEFGKCRECGAKAPKHDYLCKNCNRERMDEIHQRNAEIVRKRKCPSCGAGLRRNSSMAGWWQCEQYGAPTFRKNPDGEGCSFQCFTE